MVTTTTRTEVRRPIGTGAVVVKALPESHYRQAHLPGALNLLHDRVDKLTPALPADTNVESSTEEVAS